MSKQTRQKSSKPAAPGGSARAPKPGLAASAAATKAGAKAGTKAGRAAAAGANGAAKPAAKAKPSPRAAKAAGAAEPAVLAEGAPAPAFELPRDGGGTVGLADYAGRKLVIYFYPRANTPGCTREAIDFSRLARAFEACGAAVIGVSADSVKAQDSFRDKHALTTPLLSDPAHAMLAAYGAWGEKKLYGKTFEGVIRTTVLIGADGRVARIWRNVKVDGHADAVLAAAQAL